MAADRQQPPVWALMGPTGTGKSDLALAVAKATGAAIVNCDSVQCYRGFDIGSAKVPLAERQGVAHHLLDVASAGGLSAGCAAAAAPMDASSWAVAAHRTLAELARAGQPALLCGGTGLYLRALRQGLIAVPADAALRSAWLARESAVPGTIWTALTALDAPTAARIGENNPHRLLRALEICLLSGRPASVVWQAHRRADQPLARAIRLIVLDGPRDWLRARLLARAERMVAAGLLEEVRGLRASGVAESAAPMRSVGYREACQVLSGDLPVAELVQAMATRSWQYARRQRTWLRKEPHVAWLDAAELAKQPGSDRVGRLLALWQAQPEVAQGPQ